MMRGSIRCELHTEGSRALARCLARVQHRTISTLDVSNQHTRQHTQTTPSNSKQSLIREPHTRAY